MRQLTNASYHRSAAPVGRFHQCRQIQRRVPNNAFAATFAALQREHSAIHRRALFQQLLLKNANGITSHLLAPSPSSSSPTGGGGDDDEGFSHIHPFLQEVGALCSADVEWTFMHTVTHTLAGDDPLKLPRRFVREFCVQQHERYIVENRLMTFSANLIALKILTPNHPNTTSRGEDNRGGGGGGGLFEFNSFAEMCGQCYLPEQELPGFVYLPTTASLSGEEEVLNDPDKLFEFLLLHAPNSAYWKTLLQILHRWQPRRLYQTEEEGKQRAQSDPFRVQLIASSKFAPLQRQQQQQQQQSPTPPPADIVSLNVKDGEGGRRPSWCRVPLGVLPCETVANKKWIVSPPPPRPSCPWLPPPPGSSCSRTTSSRSDIQVVYEDDSLLVVNKSGGIPTVRDSLYLSREWLSECHRSGGGDLGTSSSSLPTQSEAGAGAGPSCTDDVLSWWIKRNAAKDVARMDGASSLGGENDNRKEDDAVASVFRQGRVHRLDQGTSGAMLWAKGQDVTAALRHQISAGLLTTTTTAATAMGGAAGELGEDADGTEHIVQTKRKEQKQVPSKTYLALCKVILPPSQIRSPKEKQQKKKRSGGGGGGGGDAKGTGTGRGSEGVSPQLPRRAHMSTPLTLQPGSAAVVVDPQNAQIRTKVKVKEVFYRRSSGGEAEDTDANRSCAIAGVLVECTVHRAKRHQVRLHLASIGLPIWNDLEYGGSVVSSPLLFAAQVGAPTDGGRPLLYHRFALHAASISFFHPVKKEWMTVEAPLPADMQGSVDELSRRSKQ